MFCHSNLIYKGKMNKNQSKIHILYYIIFKLIKKKHGQDVITAARNYEKVKTKWMKVDQDIKSMKSCKKEHLVLTFAKVDLSIKPNLVELSSLSWIRGEVLY